MKIFILVNLEDLSKEIITIPNYLYELSLIQFVYINYNKNRIKYIF